MSIRESTQDGAKKIKSDPALNIIWVGKLQLIITYQFIDFFFFKKGIKNQKLHF